MKRKELCGMSKKVPEMPREASCAAELIEKYKKALEERGEALPGYETDADYGTGSSANELIERYLQLHPELRAGAGSEKESETAVSAADKALEKDEEK